MRPHLVVAGGAFLLAVLLVDAVDVADDVGAMEGGELALLTHVALAAVLLDGDDANARLHVRGRFGFGAVSRLSKSE